MAKSKASSYSRKIITVKPLSKPMSVSAKKKLLVKKSPPPTNTKA